MHATWNPDRDVTTIEVDLKLSTMKPLHVATLLKCIAYLRTNEGAEIIKAGFRHTGITGAVNDAREGKIPSLDPFC